MKHVANIKDYTKRAVAMLIIISIVMFQMVSDVVIASMSVGENGYTAIITEKLGKYGRLFEIGGQIEETPNLPDMHKGIINMLPEETEISEYSFAANMTDYTNENCIYSNGTTSFNCNTVDLNQTIVSEHEVNINASMLSSDEYTIIYAESGNININVAKMDFKGILYAPNGNVTINGTEINVAGMIIAKNVNLYVDTFTINANQYSESIVNVLELYRNDKLLTLTGYTYEDDIVVGFESDAEFACVDIYIRNDDAAQFTYLTSTTESEYTISDYTFEQYMDIMAVAKTKYDETYESTLMTVGYSNDEYAEKLASYTLDADEDGILDGYEIWYSKTDPKCADSDGDGINDYVECFYLCTNPNEKNEFVDTDGDGILDADEINLGTHPYLKDTDFDGWPDNEDVEPLKYNDGSQKEIDYTEDRVVGLFDKVNTWIDANGNVYQYIYNFINDNVEYTMINGVVTKYYYNTENQLIAVVTINGEERSAVTYSYNGEVLSSVAYKGFLYEFEIGENTEKITIADNEYKNAEYGENEAIVTYGNGFEIKNIFNEYGDATAVYYNGELAFECQYDENGQIVSINDYVVGYEQKYTYKEDGNIETIASEKYSIAYEYSDEEYIINYDLGDSKYQQIIYNDIEDVYASQYSSLLIDGGLHENIENEAGDIEYRITKDGKIAFSNVITYENEDVAKIVDSNGNVHEYQYTNEGKISSILQNSDIVIEYYYDNLGRIVREDNLLSETTYVYEYNADGNMANRKAYVYGSCETDDLLDETYYEYGNKWKDQMTDISGMKISYDEIGNPISYRDGMEFVWAGKMLSGVKGTDEIEFTYNNEGIRTSKTVNGNITEYVIEGKDIIFEISDEETVAYIYDSDMNVIGMIIDDETYYFEKNVQSDVLRILDDNGNVMCEYVYDAWGNVICINGDEELARKNPFRYRSYYYDVETGLYYAESRYYDPVVGRFINADKIEEIIWDYTNLNMYAYCGNDPVNYYDPSGEAAVYVKTFISSDINQAAAQAKLNPEAKQIYVGAVKITNMNWANSLGTGSENKTYIISSKSEFINKWNSSLAINVLIILAHGTYDGIQFGEDSFTTRDIGDLQYREIKFIWLLCCNTGHYEYRYYNFACALSKKIRGVVIAPDQVAALNKDSNNCYYAYTETPISDIWDGRSKGWLIYRYNPYYSSLCINGRVAFEGTYDFEEPNYVTIYMLSYYLKTNGYISYK